MSINDLENMPIPQFKSACDICFWGRHNKCRYMKPEHGTVKMPKDCPDFEPYPGDWNWDLED